MQQYRQRPAGKTKMTGIESVRGETLEAAIRRMKQNKTPIKAGDGNIFTNRNEGVQEQHNPRADKFEMMLDASIAINKIKHTKLGKKDLGEEAKKNMEKENGQKDQDKNAQGKSTDGTGGKTSTTP